MASQRPEFFQKFWFSPLISRRRYELNGNFVIYTKSPSSAIPENAESQNHFAKHSLRLHLTGLRMQSTAPIGNGSGLIFACSFIKIRATVGDAKSQSQGETQKTPARFRSDHIRCFPEDHGSQAADPPVGATQFPLRSRQIEPSLRAPSLSDRQIVRAIWERSVKSGASCLSELERKRTRSAPPRSTRSSNLMALQDPDLEPLWVA